MEGRRDGGTEGRADRRTDGRTDGRRDGRRDGRMDGRTDGRTDGPRLLVADYCLLACPLLTRGELMLITTFPRSCPLVRARICNDASEKLAPRSRSFREVFAKFREVLVNLSMFSDVFEHVQIRSDAFGCNRMHFGALGCVRTLPETFAFFRFF